MRGRLKFIGTRAIEMDLLAECLSKTTLERLYNQEFDGDSAACLETCVPAILKLIDQCGIPGEASWPEY